MGSVAGRVALVAGASSGIGLAVSTRLVRDGMHVIALDLDPPASTMMTGPGTLTFETCDVTVPTDLTHAIRTAHAHGPIWALVNCAAYVPALMPAEELPIAEWHRCFDVVVTGTFLACRAVFPDLREHGGRIVNFGSGESEHPMSGQAAYASAKGAIRSLTRLLATEWGRYGVTVNTIVPVAVTPAYERWKADNPDEERERLQRTPLRRLGDPERDIAPLVSFLVSDEASWITGGMLSANGGRVMI